MLWCCVDYLTNDRTTPVKHCAFLLRLELYWVEATSPEGNNVAANLKKIDESDYVVITMFII